MWDGEEDNEENEYERLRRGPDSLTLESIHSACFWPKQWVHTRPTVVKSKTGPATAAGHPFTSPPLLGGKSDRRAHVPFSFAGCDDIIRQHKAACLRVTALLAVKDLLWIGTSAGVVLTMSIPPAVAAPASGGKPAAALPVPVGQCTRRRFGA